MSQSKKSYHQQPSINLATESHLLLLETSSEQKSFPATNLIKDSATLDYMSQYPLPQDITIHLSPQAENREQDAEKLQSSSSKYHPAKDNFIYNSINFVGWHCSEIHSNLSPKTVKLYISRFDAPVLYPQFKYWATLRAKKAEGTHLFKIKSVPKEFTRFKFEIIENFSSMSEEGEKLVCFNRIFLVSQDLNLDIEVNRNESHSYELKNEQLAQSGKDLDVSNDLDDGQHSNEITTRTKQNYNQRSNDEGDVLNPTKPKVSHKFQTERRKNNSSKEEKRRSSVVSHVILRNGIGDDNLTELTDGLATNSSRPLPRKPSLSDTDVSLHEDSFEASIRLNDATRQLESLQEDFSHLLQTASVREQNELRKRFTTMQENLQQCQESIRHVKMYMNQLSDRVQVLEDEDVKNFILEQKRVNIGLNNQIGEFKKSFPTKTDEKLKKAFELLEKKMEDRMRLMFSRHRDFTEKQIQTYLEKKLVHIRLKHPENEKIKQYNDKVQHVNKQQVKYNSRVYLEKDKPTKQHLQKKYLPEYFEMEEYINEEESDYELNSKSPIETVATKGKVIHENIVNHDWDYPPTRRITIPTPEAQDGSTDKWRKDNQTKRRSIVEKLSPNSPIRSFNDEMKVDEKNELIFKDKTGVLSKSNELHMDPTKYERKKEKFNTPINTGSRIQGSTLPSPSPTTPKLRKWEDPISHDNENDAAEPLPNHLAEQLRKVLDEENDIMKHLSASLKKYNFQF